MRYITNEDQIEIQKRFIISFLEKTENIYAKDIHFSELIYLPLKDLDPLNSFDSAKRRVLEIVELINNRIPLPPILVDKESRIIMDGNHRYLASEYLEFNVIPVLFYAVKD
jgi:ParB-like chromosome segregation protein Spo0J